MSMIDKLLTTWGLRFGFVFKAHRLVYHSTLGLSVIKKKKIISGFRVSDFGFRV